MWRVAERLVSEDAFAPLLLASPFMVGYSVHDQEEAILRLLNWPRNAQQVAPPNGGPAEPLGSSGGGGGPPSVS
jgi:hypothetical protein